MKKSSSIFVVIGVAVLAAAVAGFPVRAGASGQARATGNMAKLPPAGPGPVWNHVPVSDPGVTEHAPPLPELRLYGPHD